MGCQTLMQTSVSSSATEQPPSTTEITLNGEQTQVPRDLTVAGLLDYLKIDASRVAVELNRTIVKKTARESALVMDGAVVEIVHFVGGGR